MNKIEITKSAVNVIVGLGTYKIVRQTVENNTQPKNRRDEAVVTAGSVALGMMASDATSAYTGAKIDEIIKTWNDIKTMLKN